MEGSGIGQLAQVIKRLGYNDFDRFEFATVTSPPPAIRIKIDNMKIELDASDVVMAECLTAHNRTVSINGASDVTLAFKDELKTGDRVIVVSVNDGQSYAILDRAVTY
ncbi:DUF2577 family protein [Paenibacillus sp. SI8]|uniref:DUF2577 family protein n=1 Tax=unclassified Paenibacillus TaxID=185978 RepID=UPI003466E4C6